MNENENIRSRHALLRSFYGALEIANQTGELRTNAAGAAGMLLHFAGGDVAEAIVAVSTLPANAVCATARGYLEGIAADEAAHTQRPVAAGGRR